MGSTVAVVIVLVVLVAIALGVVMSRRRRSTQLQERFGPEYERSVSAASGDRRAAETALAERQQRREQFDVRELDDAERSRYRTSWGEIQRGFVDDPRQSLHSADRLVTEIMKTRGYPVDDDFERRADDLSVDHPKVVQHYRDARRVHDADGEVDTENQRTALTSYRSLVDDLLGDEPAHAGDGTPDTAASPAASPAAAEHTAAPDHTAPADPTAARHAGDAVADGHTDAATGGGRHALHEPEALRDASRPTDPNGTQTPRSEERTR